MNSLLEQVTALITTPNLPAPKITHALAVLGNGNMQQGLARLVRYYEATCKNGIVTSLARGRVQGALAGVLGTSVLFGIIAGIYYLDQRQKDDLDTEGQEILNAFQESVPKRIIIKRPAPIHDEEDQTNSDSEPNES